ncbi:MAG: Ig-like domain-containing protein [Planctomycetes bacterium]|nr:Ig-like domain-containing protein [Planctomycetota bacterium]
MSFALRNRLAPRILSTGAPVAMLFVLLSGCGGGSGSSLFNNFPNGGGGTQAGDFVVESVVPQQGQVWEVNRPITITFSQAVNFSSISPASISIFTLGTNKAALGQFSMQNSKTVIFQPACPTSISPSGLAPNGVGYEINITGSSQVTSTTIVSSSGSPLKAGKTITFVTATATNPNDTFDPALFYDPKPNLGPAITSATYTTIAADGTTTTQDFGNNAVVPTNKFVGPSVFFTLTFDQPILPSPSNIVSTNVDLRFEFPAGSGNYTSIPTSIQLVENCTAAGAKVRITPLGLLPGGRKLRMIIGQGFSDIKGETNPFPVNIPFDPLKEPTSQTPASPSDFDAITETFNDKSHLDTNSGFVEPLANWGNGAVQAAFNFPGQQTDFELIVGTGQTVVIDTTATTLAVQDSQSNPGTASFVNGNIYLRKLTVNNGGTIIGQGPNPLRFFVNDTVTINNGGIINVKGVDAVDVATLLTACVFPQQGGAGQCGGGDGGLGNPVTSQSCSQGGTGNGPFNGLNGGGVGGESALVALTSGGQPCYEPEDYHGGGGGGGSYSTSGEKGNNGTDTTYTYSSCNVPQGVSAVNPNKSPAGGISGIRPFTNAFVVDDFYGSMIAKQGTISSAPATNQIKVTTAGFFNTTPVTGDVGRYVAVIKGNATASWEDGTTNCTNSPQDPTLCFRSRVQVRKINTVNTTDTITMAAPTFSGTLNAPAFGDIVVVFGAGNTVQGELTTPLGGQGGGGGGNAIQSTTFPNPNVCTQDRKGGGGGGGGGILEIRALNTVTILGTLDASGGAGAAGENTIGIDRIGGGGGGGSGGTIIVESASSAVNAISVVNGAVIGKVYCRGGSRGAGLFAVFTDPVAPSTPSGMGHGGRGGKGLVQFHVPTNAQFSFPTNQPSGTNFDPNPLIMTTTFGPITRARSTWYDTGAGLAAGLPVYAFGGVCTQAACGLTGEVIADASGNVDTNNPVLASNTITVSAANLTANSVTLPFAQVNVPANAKAAEPMTLVNDLIKVGSNVGAITGVSMPDSNTIILTTDNNTSTNPTALNTGIGLGSSPAWNLIGRFFEVDKVDPLTSNVTPNFIQPKLQAGGNRVQIQFQGANADVNGNVDLNTVVPPLNVDAFGTADPTVLTGARFVRFTTTFNTATVGSVGPGSFQPRVNFFKMVFRFN